MKVFQLNHVRTYQALAIILTLIAGLLWSNRLAKTTTDTEMQKINSSLSEQIDLFKARIEPKTDAFALVKMGQTFLSNDSPLFATIPLEKASVLKPEYRDSWYLLGFAYITLATNESYTREERSNYTNKAVDALKKAAALDPSHEPTQELLKQLESSS